MAATPGNGEYSGKTALPNGIATASKYIREILDEIYEAEAKTNGMTPNPAIVQASREAGTIQLANLEVTGAGNYNIRKGYPLGSGSNKWTSYAITADRGIKYLADPRETIASGGIATATAFFAEAMRTKFIPEIDAYRFSKIYGILNALDSGDLKTNHLKTNNSALDASGVLSAVIDGLDAVSNDTGIDEGMTIYMNASLKSIIHKSSEYTKTKAIAASDGVFNTNITEINGNRVVWVPKNRMYTAIDLLDGYTNAYSDTTTTPETVDYSKFGYKPASGAKGLNFVITAPNTAMGLMVLNDPKIIPKEQSENYDADQAMIRYWHDLIVPKNKVPGLYVSVANA